MAMLVDDTVELIMPGRRAEDQQPVQRISLLAHDAVMMHGASAAAAGEEHAAAAVLDVTGDVLLCEHGHAAILRDANLQHGLRVEAHDQVAVLDHAAGRRAAAGALDGGRAEPN